tara:strand:- start:776 stop:919 length:144 start_codon:yes stop_codon:yes gene_type:complete
VLELLIKTLTVTADVPLLTQRIDTKASSLFDVNIDVGDPDEFDIELA